MQDLARRQQGARSFLRALADLLEHDAESIAAVAHVLALVRHLAE